MDFLKDIALCLIAAAAAGTLAIVIVPRGSMDKTVRASVGIFVVAVICSPLSKIDTEALNVFADFEESDFDKSYTEEMNNAVVDTFKKAIENCLKEIASELNYEIVSVNADISVDDEQCINIHKIRVVINNTGMSDISVLSEKTSGMLGVPVEMSEE